MGQAESFDDNVQINHYDAEGLRHEIRSITHVVTGQGEEAAESGEVPGNIT